MVRIVDSGDSGGYTGAGGGEVTAEVLITRRQETNWMLSLVREELS